MAINRDKDDVPRDRPQRRVLNSKKHVDIVFPHVPSPSPSYLGKNHKVFEGDVFHPNMGLVNTNLVEMPAVAASFNLTSILIRDEDDFFHRPQVAQHKVL